MTWWMFCERTKFFDNEYFDIHEIESQLYFRCCDGVNTDVLHLYVLLYRIF